MHPVVVTILLTLLALLTTSTNTTYRLQPVVSAWLRVSQERLSVVTHILHASEWATILMTLAAHYCGYTNIQLPLDLLDTLRLIQSDVSTLSDLLAAVEWTFSAVSTTPPAP